MLSHHFVIGAFQKLRGFIRAIIPGESLIMPVENLFTRAFHDLHEAKLLKYIQRSL